MSRWRFCKVLFLVSLIVAEEMCIAQTGEQWLTAEGFGKTRQRAIQDALRWVVEKGVGVWVKARSLMVNFEVKEDILSTVVKGYVKSYEVLEEGLEGELYRVRLRAKVADIFQGIEEHLSEAPELYRQMGEPRVMVLLKEKALGQPLKDEHPAEVAVTEALLREGIRVVDRRQVQMVRQREKMMALLEGDERAAWEIGEESGAEILLVGAAKAESFGSFVGGSVHSCHASIELRALWVDNGEVLAARRIEKVAAADFQLPAAARFALQKAGQQIVADGFASLMVKAFALEVAEGRTIFLRLKGSYDDLTSLVDKVEKYQGFVDVVRDEYLQERREGRLWVRVRGNLAEFLRWLLRQPFGHSRLAIVGKSATAREVTLKMR